MLEVNNLSKKYRDEVGEFYAIKDVSFTIGKGEFVALLGPSGSGKTTIANIIAGFLEPSEGDILFNSKSILEMNDDELSDYRNSSIGYLPQSIPLIPNINAFDNAILPFYLRDRDGDIKARMNDLFKRLDIYDLKERFPKNLSGGEYKRILLARAIANNPELLIVDEPTANLDNENSDALMDLIWSLEGISVLCITHDDRILKEDLKTVRLSKIK